MDDIISSPQDFILANQEPPTRKQREPQQIVELLERPVKQRKLCAELKNHFPATEDGLPSIGLDKEALEKLNHRNAESAFCHVKSKVKRPRTRCAVRESNQTLQLIHAANYLSRASQEEIARIKDFARLGGPDLTDIRGLRQPLTIMGSKESNSKHWSLPSPPKETTKSKRSTTPYDPGFGQHLIDHGIYSNNRAKPPENMEEIIARLAKPRPSLSPSQFSETAFQRFQADNYKAKDEDDVMINVIQIIKGHTEDTEVSATNTLFINLKALTDGTIVPAKPDLYYGALPEQLNLQIRKKLMDYIVPSPRDDKPLAPNFFLEVKGPFGAIGVARQQACYAGAVGARGIQVLQSYGLNEENDKLLYDNKTYTLTSTYLDGTLKIFAIHPTLSTRNSPEYHMTLLKSWTLTDSPDDFRRGAAAFRNARDFAREQRDKFIAIANSRSTL